jgi:hypothetical protein
MSLPESDKKIYPHGYPDEMPQSIQQAVDILLVVLTEKQLTDIAAMKEHELTNLHFSIGMWIRNQFGLWSANEALLKDTGAFDPDSASSVIIDALNEKLIS